MTPLRTFGLPPRKESSKVPLTSTINDLSPCPSPLIPVVGVRAVRWNGHASSGAQKATFATPTGRDKHVGTIRLSTGYRGGESARWLPAVAGRAPMRRFVQQPLPFSTSTRFVNSLVIKFSEYTPIYTHAFRVRETLCKRESARMYSDLDLSRLTCTLESVPRTD